MQIAFAPATGAILRNRHRVELWKTSAPTALT